MYEISRYMVLGCMKYQGMVLGCMKYQGMVLGMYEISRYGAGDV